MVSEKVVAVISDVFKLPLKLSERLVRAKVSFPWLSRHLGDVRWGDGSDAVGDEVGGFDRVGLAGAAVRVGDVVEDQEPLAGNRSPPAVPLA
jgi:hypothetical protein